MTTISSLSSPPECKQAHFPKPSSWWNAPKSHTLQLSSVCYWVSAMYFFIFYFSQTAGMLLSSLCLHVSVQFRAVTYLSWSHYSHVNSHQLRASYLTVSDPTILHLTRNSSKKIKWYRYAHLIWLVRAVQCALRQLEDTVWKRYQRRLNIHFFSERHLKRLRVKSDYLGLCLSLCDRNAAVQSSLNIPQHFSEQQSRWQWLRPGVQCQQILLCIWIVSG